MTDRVSVVAAVLLLAAACGAAERGQNLLANADFEQGDAGWRPYGGGFLVDESVAHSGRRSLRCASAAEHVAQGVVQDIVLDPPVQHPFRVSGWSKAEGVTVGQDCAVYLDCHHADGTPLWGQTARFRGGTHDWEYAEHVFTPAKPIQRIRVHVFIRKTTGAAWFDDVRAELLPFEFRGVRVLPGLYGGASVGCSAITTLPACWKAWLILENDSPLGGSAGPVAHATGQDQPARFCWMSRALVEKPEPYTLRIEATDAFRGETIRTEQKLRLGSGEPARGYAVWTASSMERVFPHSLSETMEAAPVARVALAGREYESFQIVLLPAPAAPLKDVRVEVSDLACAATGARLPARHVQWQQVGCVRVEKLRPHPAAPDAAPGWWPDPLLPVERFGVAPGFAQSLWVTVHAPPGTPPGEYRGTVTIRPPGRPPAAVAVQATVYGFDLPAAGHLKTAFALMDGFLEKLYGRPLKPALRQRFGDFVLDHLLNPDDISRTEPPALDDLLHYRERANQGANGMNAFNVLNMVEERGDRTWVCYSEKGVYTPAFRQRLVERLDPAVAQFRQHGLLDGAYIYTFDERGEDFYPILREYFGLVKQRYPGIRTFTTAHVPLDPAKFRDLNVDWACPLTPGYRFEDAEKCRAAGHQVWAYVCLGPGHPYANWILPHPLIEARILPWQAIEQKMDGLLYWGVNIWSHARNDRPIDPAAGPLLDWSITTGGEYDWLHGDGLLLYPGKDGPIGSIRLANLRDGLEDAEYLWLLAQKLGSPDAARAACRPVAASLTEFTRDPLVLASRREAIARRIAAPEAKR